jgi:DNA-binding NarL/FixJ family response regulator
MFAEAGIAALQELLEPLAKAARLQTELQSLGWRASVALRALDQLHAGVIVIDGAGRVIELNRAAERIVRRGDGLIIRNGRHEASGVLDSDKLAKLIAEAADEKAGAAVGRMLVGRRGGRPAYTLTVAPLGAELAVQERPLVMIFVTDPDELSPSEKDLAEFFGLSPAESRVAAAMMAGKTLRNIASASGMRITTLRTQLSSISRKVGVTRQTELIRVLASIRAAGLPPPDAI